MALNPRESGKIIATLSKNVFIEEEGVKNLATDILGQWIKKSLSESSGFGLGSDFSQHDLHPNPSHPKAVDWIFVLDTLNFSFWSANPESKWKVNGQSGYFGLCAAIKRAVDNNVPILDPHYYAHITKEDLEDIMRGDEGTDPIPMIDERVQNLHQVGEVLIKKYDSTFTECVSSCNKSAEQLVKLVVNEMECFRDEADFHGHRVSLYKRAQILVGDIWACFKGKDWGEFTDIDKITMFADYRIPQVLLHYGAMRYSNPLLGTLQAGKQLTPGSLEEIEIRGCSIEIVERIIDVIRSEIHKCPNINLDPKECNAIRIDHFLWDYRREHAAELESLPFHKVRTIYY